MDSSEGRQIDWTFYLQVASLYRWSCRCVVETEKKFLVDCVAGETAATQQWRG
jgi:hypothetical protein